MASHGALPTNTDLFPSPTGSVDTGLKSSGFRFVTSPAVSAGTVQAPIYTRIPVSSAGSADQLREPGSATCPVGHQQPPHKAFLPGPVFSQPLVASCSAFTGQAQQPSQLPFKAFSTGPSPAQCLSKLTSWDVNTQAAGDKGYSSPLINLYSDLEVDCHSGRAPVSHKDIQEAPPAQKLTRLTQSHFILRTKAIERQCAPLKLTWNSLSSGIMNMSAPHAKITIGQARGLRRPGKSLSPCQRMIGSAQSLNKWTFTSSRTMSQGLVTSTGLKQTISWSHLNLRPDGTQCTLDQTHQLLDQWSQSINGPATPSDLILPLLGSLSL